MLIVFHKTIDLWEYAILCLLNVVLKDFIKNGASWVESTVNNYWHCMFSTYWKFSPVKAIFPKASLPTYDLCTSFLLSETNLEVLGKIVLQFFTCKLPDVLNSLAFESCFFLSSNQRPTFPGCLTLFSQFAFCIHHAASVKAFQGSILTVVHWPQASKNTTVPQWLAWVASENCQWKYLGACIPQNIRVQGKCFLHLTLTRGSTLPPCCGESSHKQ